MVRQALITGGAGFIGSHLTKLLLDAGYNVTVLDNLSTGSRQNLAQLSGNPKLKFIIADVSDEKVLAPLVRKANVIFHLAAAVGVQLIMDDPVNSMVTNIHGTEAVLRHAAHTGTRLVIASTSEVYGKSSKVPFSESDDLVFGNTSKTRWSYACSKAIDEYLALAYHRQSNLPVSVIRYFNTVGARQSDRYGMVLPRFVNQALQGKPLTVHGDGSQRRTFTHVNDSVDATFRISQHQTTIGEVFNVGGSVEISILELAKAVIDRVGSSSTIETIPYSKVYSGRGFEDMARRVPDCSKLDQAIGYTPEHSLNDIIDDVIDTYTIRNLGFDSLPRVAEAIR